MNKFLYLIAPSLLLCSAAQADQQMLKPQYGDRQAGSFGDISQGSFGNTAAGSFTQENFPRNQEGQVRPVDARSARGSAASVPGRQAQPAAKSAQ